MQWAFPSLTVQLRMILCMRGGTLHDVTFSGGKMNNHVDYRL